MGEPKLNCACPEFRWDFGDIGGLGYVIALIAMVTSRGPVHPGVVNFCKAGHGISKAVLDRIFEPFYTTKALNGTGLGLWIPQGIIERHGGYLRVRSSEEIATVGLSPPSFCVTRQNPMRNSSRQLLRQGFWTRYNVMNSSIK